MSVMRNIELSNFRFDVNSVSQRAVAKYVDETISIDGQSGSNGHFGPSGAPGHYGSNGTNGVHGGDGGDGTNGFDGQSGQHGTDARHAFIWLSGTVENLNVKVKISQTLNSSPQHYANFDRNDVQHLSDVNHNFQLANSKGIILVQASGGDGGDGGHGGDGGNGGSGGRGGSGYSGIAGHDGRGEGASGGNGGRGGDGGRGGRGGNGGNGGSGGNGGNAGAGGHVQVRSLDARLLMLIELNCRAGINGKGGHCGRGGHYGNGGAGGSGGKGGWGGRGGPNGSNGRDGMPGTNGSNGSDGHSGNHGHHGHDGCTASDGSIQYAVVDADDNIIETGPDKYHASICSYTITDENNDGIYEPNSDFFITNIEWTNNGAMTLPSGSILSFPSTEYISSNIEDVSVLPGAYVNELLVDHHRFKCHLNAAPTPSINQPYIHPVKITSNINLLNRLFSGSEFSTSLMCQYPIQITHIEIPTFLGPNERAIVTIHFTNISTRSYGTCLDSAGSIEFILSTHPLLRISPINGEHTYQITPNGRGHYKMNEEIPPQSTKHINFEIMLDDNAFDQLYESLFWNLDLSLRDMQIEQHRNSIRVVPTFKSNIRTDVLLVTNTLVNRAEFLAYRKLFQLFKYSSQTWDVERYGAFHSPETQWLNTADLIIFIYSNPRSTFKTIKSQQLLQHINSSENAGFICIGPFLTDEFDFALFDYNNLQFLNEKEKAKSEATNHLWSTIGFGWPSADELNEKANEIRKNHEKKDDHQFLYQTVYDTINEGSANCMTIVYGNKYVFKSTLNSQVGNRVILVPSYDPWLVNSHLPFTLQAQSNTTQQSRDVSASMNDMDRQSQIQNIIQHEINLSSQFGRLICAILFYQGFAKSYAIIAEKRELSSCIFATGTDRFTFNQILVGLAMSIIEREYDRGTREFQSSKQLINQVANMIARENNITSDHRTGANGWFYLLIQSLYEYIDSKFWSSFPWCSCTNKAKQRHKLQEILSDLHSLSPNEIRRNKEIGQAVQILRLQKLADLKFPAADKREHCARPISEILAWQQEQRITETQSSIEQPIPPPPVFYPDFSPREGRQNFFTERNIISVIEDLFLTAE
ncbi:unnamed protein product [Adineta ricciae]|uniref:DUF7932 domain-containing protein n=1 Tax=Adineta ricciae TaxID=249248 RepID=A0A815HEZ4_ADIRI|nr:unnamed protein product [Adineta ricciae]CAF1351508.1 unnamed protein product [Adineta ricciae]